MKPLQIKLYDSKEEERFASRCRILQMAHEIVDWFYKPFKFAVGNGAYYEPDFLLVYTTHFEIVEVKGETKTKKLKKSRPFTREDDIIKLKAVKKFNPYFKFVIAWENGKDNWQFKEMV